MEVSPIEIDNDFLTQKIQSMKEGTSIQLDYPQFLLPGIIGLTILSIGIYSIGVPLVFLRENQYLKYINTYPLSKRIYLSVDLIAGIIISIIISCMLFLISYFIFDVTIIEENIIYLFIVFISGIFSFISIGIFISSISKTINNAAIIANVVFLPLLFLSEVYFTLPNLPFGINNLMNLNPLYQFVNILRKILFNQNIDNIIFIKSILIILLSGILFCLLSFKFFKWYPKNE